MEGTQRLWQKYQRNVATSDDRVTMFDMSPEVDHIHMDPFDAPPYHHSDDIDLDLLEDEPHGDDDEADDDDEEEPPANICVNFEDFVEHGVEVEAMNVEQPHVDTAPVAAAAAAEPMIYLDSSQSEMASPAPENPVEQQSARDILCQTLLIQLMTRYDGDLKAREEQTKQRRAHYATVLSEFHAHSTPLERLRHYIRTGIDTIRQQGLRTLSPDDLLAITARLNRCHFAALVAQQGQQVYHAYYRNYLILVIGRDHFIVQHK